MTWSQDTPPSREGTAPQLGIIGGGVMAEAIFSRLLAQQLYRPEQVIVSDVSSDRLQVLQQTYGICTTLHNLEVVQGAEVIVLAIKPQILPSIAAELAALPLDHDSSQRLWLSILAGVPLAKLEAILGEVAIIRVMPNTPALVGAGITALAPNPRVTPPQVAIAETLFKAVGTVLIVPEGWMDAITGLSGSGPAFVAIAIEALTDGGVAAGLPRSVAAQLAVQTVRGTTELMLQKNLHPALLKDQVTSPGGTTIAGVASLEASGFRAALIQAVQTAYRRSQELGQ